MRLGPGGQSARRPPAPQQLLLLLQGRYPALQRGRLGAQQQAGGRRAHGEQQAQRAQRPGPGRRPGAPPAAARGAALARVAAGAPARAHGARVARGLSEWAVQSCGRGLGARESTRHEAGEARGSASGQQRIPAHAPLAAANSSTAATLGSFLYANRLPEKEPGPTQGRSGPAGPARRGEGAGGGAPRRPRAAPHAASPAPRRAAPSPGPHPRRSGPEVPLQPRRSEMLPEAQSANAAHPLLEHHSCLG